MDQLLDRPIDAIEQDVFGFGEVAKSLVDAINAQPNSTSLTLGLDGAWGSGKSSILNLMKQSLAVEGSTDGIGTVVVSFSPWLITNRTALVSAFFAQLSTALDKAEERVPTTWWLFQKNSAKTLSKARKGLRSFSKFASRAATVGAAFDPTFISAAALGGINAASQVLDGTDSDGKTLEALKDELTHTLSELAKADRTFRVLVLIDDLDRLDPNDALEVLRLVKSVGDFPAITYLLAYDRGVIADAIARSISVENGDAYLEKIIQYSFKVPPLEAFRLRFWLRSELEKMYPGEIDVESTLANAVLDKWAGRLLTTPRDVRRLLFSVRAVWAKIQGKANILDLVWIQIVEQKASSVGKDLYSWVIGYLQSLEAIAIGGNVTGKRESEKELLEILNNIGWKSRKESTDFDSFDFHHLDEILCGISSSYINDDEDDWAYHAGISTLQTFRLQKRLSSPWHWRLYFALTPPSHAITDDEWTALDAAAIQSSDILMDSISKLLELHGEQKQDSADQIVNRTYHLLNSGSLLAPNNWLIAMCALSGTLERFSKSTGWGFEKEFKRGLHRIFIAHFKKEIGETRDETIDRIFGDKKLISVSADFLRAQMSASTKDDYEKKEHLAISESELEYAKFKQLEIYNSLNSDELISLSDPYEVLLAWSEIENSIDGPSALIQRAIETDVGFLDTLSALKLVTSTAQNGIARIPQNYLATFVDASVLKVRLTKLAHSNSQHAERAKRLLDLWWDESR